MAHKDIYLIFALVIKQYVYDDSNMSLLHLVAPKKILTFIHEYFGLQYVHMF